MASARRILIIPDMSDKPTKTALSQAYRIGKGFIRLGHDVRYFNYHDTAMGFSPIKSKKCAAWFGKKRADEAIANLLAAYAPDMVYFGLVRLLDGRTVQAMREAAPKAVFVASDSNPWPEKGPNRIDAAVRADILTATNDGAFLHTYRKAGVPLCAFMPYACDPDIDRRYEFDSKWRSDILWTGLISHASSRYPGERMREEIVSRLAGTPNAAVYGCCGRKGIWGMDYFHAISGARIGLSINGDNTVRLYHSDRPYHYLACGTMVLAKRVPDSELLFRDATHLRYFETADEFFELAEWYLAREDERRRIADSGMEWIHKEYNCVKIAGYILNLADTGDYTAPWRNG